MGKKLTHEEFIQRFLKANNHNLTILSEYVNAATKIHVRCNTHNIEFYTAPATLLKNCGCKQCGIEKTANSRRITHTEFIERLLKKNDRFKNNEFIVVGKYFNNLEPIECLCTKCGHRWSTSPGVLLCGSGCPECGRFNRGNDKRFTNEQFVEKVLSMNNGIKPLDCYVNYTTHIRFQCSNNHIWDTTPQSVLAGHGCPYCAGNQVWIGFNDLWTTRPDVAALLDNSDDGYTCTYGSLKFLNFKCPNCGNIELKQVVQVSRQGLSCSRCSDGVSYPNKFARAMLDQLPLDYHKCEYRPDWAKPYLYDNYFIHNNTEYILEIDGALHYKEATKLGRTLKEVYDIDQIKTRLAAEHGIDVIRIECINSSYDYIKHNLLSSKLNEIFDLSCIDWDLCNKKAQKNLIKEACDLYMSVTKDFNDIAKILHVCQNTVYHYIKIGAKFEWCNYDPIIANKIRIEKSSKPIVVIDDHDNILHRFDSIRGCERDMKEKYGIVVYREGIKRSLRTHKPYNGFNFRFANKTTQN